MDNAAELCALEQAALAARLRVGAETIRMQERRLSAARLVSTALKQKLLNLASVL